MNCREYIIEFEERGSLSEPARLHLTVCADCQKASERQTQVWLLIDGFKPVAAPSDFDFHVKARIANAKPSDFQKSVFLPILRYVLPLNVAVLILGIFVFNSSYFTGAPTAPPIAQKAVSTSPTQSDLPMTVSSANQLAFAPPPVDEKSLISSGVPNQTKNVRNAPIETAELSSDKTPKSKIKNETEGGSRLSSITPVSPILPLNIGSNANVAAPRIESQKPVDERETLKIMGIEYVLENAKRTIKSVQENSIAARSGIKIGDVIEQVKVNSLTVRRGTEKLEIVLR